MSTLEFVSDYIADVRTLLQDKVAPYRYDDTTLLAAFNSILLEARRLRADLFVFRHHDAVPHYTTVAATKVHMEPPFRLALVYGATARALEADQEDVQDVRAALFKGVFTQMLTGSAPPVAVSAGRQAE